MADTSAVASTARRIIDRTLQTAYDMVEKERGQYFVEGDCEYRAQFFHIDDITFGLAQTRSAFDALDEIASNAEPDVKHAIYCALLEFTAGLSTAALATHSPIVYNRVLADYIKEKRKAGIERGNEVRSLADKQWRNQALALAKKIQAVDLTIKPGRLIKEIRKRWPAEGGVFSDRQLGDAIRNWKKSGELHDHKKVQSAS
jgi:hypothetical protein